MPRGAPAVKAGYPRRAHAFQGWPALTCVARLHGGECGRKRNHPSHLSYPCGICGEMCWSVDARLRHAETRHHMSALAWR